MRALTWREVEDILMGAAIMGCGGGGELAEGHRLLREVYDTGRSVELAAPGELDGAVLVACPYGVGGLTSDDGTLPGGGVLAEGHPAALAVCALGEHVGHAPGALMTGELGATSVADTFVPAAALGLPVVDADAIGRAVPELQNSLFSVHGVPITPQAVVNEMGDTVLITAVADDARAEALVRALAVASDNCVWVADHLGPWEAISDVVIPGAISQALRVGAARRAAAEGGDDDVAAAAAAAGGGAVLFRGRVLGCEWKERGGFTWGDVHLEGCAADAGSGYRVWFKNENLMTWRDGAPDVTAPDLVAVLDRSGAPVTNPHAVTGAEVTVIGLPAAAAWREPQALEYLGPRHFGFDVDYVPLGVSHPA